jgi:type 1 glutamine amidotransferase
MTGFKPAFSECQVIVLNYNGDAWPEETRRAFVDYVQSGGGVVIVHAADNSFPDWKEFNEIIGLGGWGGRNEKSGPYARFVDGKLVRDNSPGAGGSHGQQHAFVVETRAPQHPIMEGLPSKWLHNKDELYDRLRGPGVHMEVLATAYSDKAKGGSGYNEPMLMTITFGQGRIFHTTLGHSPEAMKCAGFITTLQRGAEWAATGKVTQKVPEDFPTAEQLRLRE